MIRASAPKAQGRVVLYRVKMDPCQDITGGGLSTLHRVNSVRCSDVPFSASSRDVPSIPWLLSLLYEVIM